MKQIQKLGFCDTEDTDVDTLRQHSFINMTRNWENAFLKTIFVVDVGVYFGVGWGTVKKSGS